MTQDTARRPPASREGLARLDWPQVLRAWASIGSRICRSRQQDLSVAAVSAHLAALATTRGGRLCLSRDPGHDWPGGPYLPPALWRIHDCLSPRSSAGPRGPRGAFHKLDPGIGRYLLGEGWLAAQRRLCWLQGYLQRQAAGFSVTNFQRARGVQGQAPLPLLRVGVRVAQTPRRCPEWVNACLGRPAWRLDPSPMG